MAPRKIHTLWIIGLLMASVAGYFFYSHPLWKGESMRKSAFFLGKDPAFDFTFEYPIAGWSLEESQGRTEKYDALHLQGAFDEQKHFRTLIEIVVKPLPKAESSAEVLGAFLKRVSAWPKFRVISQKEMNLGREKAHSAIFESEARLPMQDLKAKPVMVRQQTLFLVRADKLYRLSLHSLAEPWQDNEAAFQQILRTFEFTNHVPRTIFDPGSK